MMFLASLVGPLAPLVPAEKTMILEITGEESRVDAFLDTLKSFTILELVRTGRVALVRGAKQT